MKDFHYLRRKFKRRYARTRRGAPYPAAGPGRLARSAAAGGAAAAAGDCPAARRRAASA